MSNVQNNSKNLSLLAISFMEWTNSEIKTEVIFKYFRKKLPTKTISEYSIQQCNKRYEQTRKKEDIIFTINVITVGGETHPFALTTIIDDLLLECENMIRDKAYAINADGEDLIKEADKMYATLDEAERIRNLFKPAQLNNALKDFQELKAIVLDSLSKMTFRDIIMNYATIDKAWLAFMPHKETAEDSALLDFEKMYSFVTDIIEEGGVYVSREAVDDYPLQYMFYLENNRAEFINTLQSYYEKHDRDIIEFQPLLNHVTVR
jgi:hypothetical protein